MNWYTRAKIAQVQGEFWITDSGQAMGADGDIGDTNHEGYVMRSILSSYDMDYESNMVDIEDPQFLEDFIRNEFEDTVEYLATRGEITPQEAKALLEEGLNDPENHGKIVDILTTSDVMRMKGATEDEISAVRGEIDARSFAMKQWGWKRLEGRHIETWTLTPGDLDTIANGLRDAYGEISDEEEFYLEIHGTGKTISMTYAQITKKETNTEDITGKIHQQVYDKQFEEQDKPSSPFYKDWN